MGGISRCQTGADAQLGLVSGTGVAANSTGRAALRLTTEEQRGLLKPPCVLCTCSFPNVFWGPGSLAELPKVQDVQGPSWTFCRLSAGAGSCELGSFFSSL